MYERNIWFGLTHPAFTYTGPSSAPEISSISANSFSSAVVLWKEMNCSYRNGLITGYILRYKSDGGLPHFIAVQNANLTYQLEGLTACTRYTLRIAAENEAGIGPFSGSVSFTTMVPGKAHVGQIHTAFSI